MMTIVLLVGWFQLFRRNESSLWFPMRKVWRLRNVRSPIIDPLLQCKFSLLSPSLGATSAFFFSSFKAGLVWLSNSSQRTLSSRVFFLLCNNDAYISCIMFILVAAEAFFKGSSFSFSRYFCCYHPRSIYLRMF